MGQREGREGEEDARRAKLGHPGQPGQRRGLGRNMLLLTYEKRREVECQHALVAGKCWLEKVASTRASDGECV